MKKEYTDDSTASSAATASKSDDVTVNYQAVVADIVTSTAGPKREVTIAIEIAIVIMLNMLHPVTTTTAMRNAITEH